MRRTDSKWLASDVGADFSGELSNLRAHAKQVEQPAAAPSLGEVAEPGSPHWESAWIDLGGEG
ncbi:MAG TPA: hypothetical protein VKU02_21025 [Gemmataceae bacterium]|nr:hypothetical protein [Gemmataceae bacterium]